MIESITKEVLTTSGDEGASRGSRYHLDEVNRGAGLLPALLVTGEARRAKGRDRPEQNPVLIAPSAAGTSIGVYHANSTFLDRGRKASLWKLLEAAEADEREEEDEEEGDPPALDFLEDPSHVAGFRFGLFDYFRLAETVCYGLNAGWMGPEDKECYPPEGLQRWVRKRTAQAINTRLHSYYQQTIERLKKSHPQVVDVQRKVFAATFGTPWMLFDPELYKRPYLVSDLTHYRAAAVALANAPSMTPFRPYRQDVHETLEDLDTGRWRGLFSPDRKSYRALNRTLDALPGGVPHGLLTNLSRMRLKEPIHSRSSLAVAMLYQSVAGAGPEAPQSAFMADPDRIKRAVSIVAAHTHQPLSFRKTADLRDVVRFLIDYPGAQEHRGNIVGLAEKSVRWHREEAQNAARQQAQRLGVKRKAKHPPVELPDDDGLEFLADVERICLEGQVMGNCVGSYAALAVEGGAYLFHVERRGEHATAQVDPRGSLVQASGPSNRPNGASKWAATALRRWGRSFEQLRHTAEGLEKLDYLDPIPF